MFVFIPLSYVNRRQKQKFVTAIFQKIQENRMIFQDSSPLVFPGGKKIFLGLFEDGVAQTTDTGREIQGKTIGRTQRCKIHTNSERLWLSPKRRLGLGVRMDGRLFNIERFA